MRYSGEIMIISCEQFPSHDYILCSETSALFSQKSIDNGCNEMCYRRSVHQIRLPSHSLQYVIVILLRNFHFPIFLEHLAYSIKRTNALKIIAIGILFYLLHCHVILLQERCRTKSREGKIFEQMRL